MDEHELVETELTHPIYRQRLMNAYRRVALEQARRSQANNQLVTDVTHCGADSSDVVVSDEQVLFSAPSSSKPLSSVQLYEQLPLF